MSSFSPQIGIGLPWHPGLSLVERAFDHAPSSTAYFLHERLDQVYSHFTYPTESSVFGGDVIYLVCVYFQHRVTFPVAAPSEFPDGRWTEAKPPASIQHLYEMNDGEPRSQRMESALG